MAVQVAKLEAVLSAENRGFNRDIDHSEKKMHKFGSVVSKAALGAGAAIGVGLGVVAKVGWDEFNQGQKVAAQTNAVLKSTGGIAHVTAKHVDELGKAIMNKSGIDDEAVKSGENMLLTFKNIRNEAGAGNKIFDQATNILFDMSTALGTDARKSAIQLGKALNDPIKGVSALARVGVTFTEGQKEVIKKLVETGHTAEAQKIILRELTSEFGGSAKAAGETLGGQLSILREKFNNWAGDLVGKVIPVLLNVANAVIPVVAAALSAVSNFIRDHINPAFARMAQVAKQEWPKITATAKSVFFWMQANLFPIIIQMKQLWISGINQMSALLRERSPELRRLFESLGQVMRILAQITIPILKAAIFVLRADIIVTIAILNALIVVLDKVRGAISFAARVSIAFGKDVANAAKVAGSAIQTMWEEAKKPINVMGAAFRTAAAAAQKLVDAIKWLIDHIPDIPKVPHIGFPHVPYTNIGDADPGAFMMQGPASISPSLYDELAGARHFGLVLRSGYRPGAMTKHGTPSDHGVYPSKAIDVAGSSSRMAAFFRWLIGQRDVKQAFYDPLGSIFGGVLSSYREGGHSDHVHVASYDSGGFLRPGWNLAYNGLGRPEPVGRGGGLTIINNLPNYIGDESLVGAATIDALETYFKRNGRPPYGGF